MQEGACRLGQADSVAGKIGAVNTLVRRPDGGMDGHNTDWDAAISAVEAAIGVLCPATNAELASRGAVGIGRGGPVCPVSQQVDLIRRQATLPGQAA